MARNRFITLLYNCNFTSHNSFYILGKLLQGVPVKRVIRDAHSREPEEKSQRLHLINRQDVVNICRKYGVNYSQSRTQILHQDDVISVEAWVAGQNEKETSSVLFYKPQGAAYEALFRKIC